MTGNDRRHHEAGGDDALTPVLGAAHAAGWATALPDLTLGGSDRPSTAATGWLFRPLYSPPMGQ
jgi:hypothetical protein